MITSSSPKEWILKVLATVLMCIFSATAAIHAQTNVPIVEDGTSPDGKYIVEVSAANGKQKSRIEIKTLPDRKVVGKLAESDFQVEAARYSLHAVWNADSSAFALNFSEGRNVTFCLVFVQVGGVWKEAGLPGKPIARVRAKGTQKEGKYQDYLFVHEWTSPKELTLHYQGNSGEVYQLNCRLAGGGKPRVAHLKTIEPAKEDEAEAEPKYDYEDYAFNVLAGGSEGSADGLGAAAQFKWPNGVAVDAAGNVFVGDRGNHVVRRISQDGAVSTLAGSAGEYGNADGAGATARFRYPLALTVAADGNVYVADSSNRAIRKVTPSGAVSTVADPTALASRAPGPGDPPAEPIGVAADKDGNIYVAMRNDYIIRKIASDRAVTTLAGSPGIPGTADGPAETARFELPWAVAVDEKRNVYVADGQTIRKIDPSGVVTTLAGSAGKEGSTDGTGSAARFVNLHGIAVDSAGNVYVADAGNRNVRKITPAGVVKTLRDPRNRSPFVEPVGVAVDDKGHVYVADEDAFSIVVGKPAR